MACTQTNRNVAAHTITGVGTSTSTSTGTGTGTSTSTRCDGAIVVFAVLLHSSFLAVLSSGSRVGNRCRRPWCGTNSGRGGAHGLDHGSSPLGTAQRELVQVDTEQGCKRDNRGLVARVGAVKHVCKRCQPLPVL